MTKRPSIPELAEAKRILTRAKAGSNVTMKQLAFHLGTSFQHVDHMFNFEQKHMRLADLLLLSKQPDMREFVQQVLIAIQFNVDNQMLRVCDLDVMSSASPDDARAALRTVAGRLWPEIGPIASQTPDEVENGRDTGTNGVSVRRARAGRPAANGRSRPLVDG